MVRVFSFRLYLFLVYFFTFANSKSHQISSGESKKFSLSSNKKINNDPTENHLRSLKDNNECPELLGNKTFNALNGITNCYKIKLQGYDKYSENVVSFGLITPIENINTLNFEVSCGFFDGYGRKIKDSEICKKIADEEKKYSFYILFKTLIEIHRDDYLVISSTINFELTSEGTVSYAVNLARYLGSQSVEEKKNIKLSLEPYSPSILKLMVTKNFEGSFIIYSTEKKTLELIKGSLFDSYKTGNHSNIGRFHIFTDEDFVKENLTTFYIRVLSTEQKSLELMLNYTNIKINYQIRDGSSSYIHQLYNCLQPHYYVFYENESNEIKDYFSFEELNNPEVRVNHKIQPERAHVHKKGDEMILDILPPRYYSLLSKGKKINFENGTDIISIRVDCDVFSETKFIFHKEKESFNFGKKYLHFSSQGSADVNFITDQSKLILKNTNKESPVKVLIDKKTELVIQKEEEKELSYNKGEHNFSFDTEEEGSVVLKITTSQMNDFLDLNKELSWDENKTSSKEFNPDSTMMFFTLPIEEEDIQWVLMDVKVEADSDFMIYYGNHETVGDSSEERYNPIWEKKIKAQSKEKVITIINPFYYLEAYIQKYSLIFISDKSKFSKIQVTLHKNLDLIATSLNQEKGHVFIKNNPKDNPLTFPYLGKDPNERMFFYMAVHSCDKKETPKFSFQSLSILEKESTRVWAHQHYEKIQSYVVGGFPLNFFGIYKDGFIQSHNYSGVFLSYSTFNDSSKLPDDKCLEKYYNFTSQIVFNQKEKKLYWDKLEDIECEIKYSFKYELYLLPDTDENAGLIDNDCFLNEEKKNPNTKLQVKEVKNDGAFSFDPDNQSYRAIIVGILEEPIPLRILYQPTVASTFEYSKFVEYPTLKSEIKSNVSVIILDTTSGWDYLDIKISEPEFKYYTKLDSVNSLDEITLPQKRKDNLREEIEGYNFTLQNPTKKSGNNSKIFYFIILFTNEKLRDKKTVLSYEYKTINKDKFTEMKPFSEGKPGYYSMVGPENFRGKNFLLSGIANPTKLNDVMLASKLCGNDLEVIVSSFENKLTNFTLKRIYNVYNIETYTDLVFNFETKEKEGPYLGFQLIVLGDEFSVKDRQKVIEELNAQRDIYFNEATKELSWSGQSEAEYEVMIVKDTAENKEIFDNISNDCYVERLLKDETYKKHQGVYFEKTKAKYYNFNKDEYGTFKFSVVAVLGGVVPLRMKYHVIQKKIPNQESKSKFEIIDVKSLPESFDGKFISRNVLIDFRSESYLYYTFEIDKSFEEYKYYITNTSILSHDFIPLPDEDSPKGPKNFTVQTQANGKKLKNYSVMKLNSLGGAFRILTKKGTDAQLKDEDGIFYFNQQQSAEIKGDSYSNFLKFDETFKYNKDNSITLIAKSCSKSSELSIYSGYLELIPKTTLKQNFEFFNFDTATDLELLLKKTTDNYSGITFSYGLNINQTLLEKLKKISQKPLKINKNDNELTWEALEGFEYEVYIFQNTDKGKTIPAENLCFLKTAKENKKQYNLELVTTRSNSFKVEKRGSFLVTVLAKSKEILPVVFNYEPLSFDIDDTLKIDCSLIPKNEYQKIYKVRKVIVFKLNKAENWDYVKFHIKNIQYQYYFSYGELNNLEDLKIPSVEGGHSLQKDSNLFVSFFRKNSHYQPYIVVEFTEKSIDETQKSTDELMQFMYSLKTIKDPKEINYEKDNTIFSNDSNFLNEEFKFYKGIDLNKKNNIYILAKSCGATSNTKLTLSFYNDTEASSNPLSNEFQLIKVTTDSGLIGKVSGDKEKFKCVVLSYQTQEQLTEEEVNKILRFKGEIKQLKNNTLTWNKLESASYEVYIIEKDDKDIEIFENDCLFYSSDNSKKKGYLGTTKEEKVTFDKIKKESYAIVYAVIDKPFPIRIKYSQIALRPKRLNKIFLFFLVFWMIVFLVFLVLCFRRIFRRRCQKESVLDEEGGKISIGKDKNMNYGLLTEE